VSGAEVRIVNRFTGDETLLPGEGRSTTWEWVEDGVAEANLNYEGLGWGCCPASPVVGRDELVVTVGGEDLYAGPLTKWDASKPGKIDATASDRSLWARYQLRLLRTLITGSRDAAQQFLLLMEAAGACDPTGIETFNVNDAGVSAGSPDEIGGYISAAMKQLDGLVRGFVIGDEMWIGPHDYGRADVTLTNQAWSDDGRSLGLVQDLFAARTLTGVPYDPAGGGGQRLGSFPIDTKDAVLPECGGLIEWIASSDGDPIVSDVDTQVEADGVALRSSTGDCAGDFLTGGDAKTASLCRFPLDLNEIRPGLHVNVDVETWCGRVDGWMRVAGMVFAEVACEMRVMSPVLGPPRITP